MRSGERPERSAGLSGEQLENEYQAALDSLETARTRLAEAQLGVSYAEKRVRSLHDLLVVEARTNPDVASEGFATANTIVTSAEAVIREKGGSIRLAELRRELLDRGVALPGRGTEANLLGYLTRSGGRIERTGRGVYAIPSGDPEQGE